MADDARAERALASAGRPWRDPALVVGLLLFDLAFLAWYRSKGLPIVVQDGVRAALRAAGWPTELASDAANATVSTVFVLLPLLLVIALVRLRPRQVGLAPRRLGLGLCLVLLSIGLAGLVQLVAGQPTLLWTAPAALPLTLTAFVIGVFINGLPEELLYRGVMLPRLRPWLRQPHHALVLTSSLFVASHIPVLLTRSAGVPWWVIVVGVLVSPGPQPTGLVWGNLAYRTRSIWPGVLWHTSFITLGILFF